MEKSYFSSSWYRVENLRLRLRDHARLHRTLYRNQVWYVLQDRTSGRFHRFTPETYLVISLMDGRHSVQQIWDIACEQLHDKVLTQDEVIRLLAQLHQADVLSGDVPPDIEELAERGKKQRTRRVMMSFLNPLAQRFGILDPNEFLDATNYLVRPFFSWFGALLFIAIVCYAGIQAGMNWAALTSDVADRVLATENLFLLLAAYPLIKALHELGHAYAVKRWGGDVHEIGIMMLVFMPVPYVDASDSLAFPGKWQRALVAAAGILVEVLLAALAVIVWVNAEPGLVRAFAFNVILIGGVSTVLFNGNPLLKFDGYYVLSDLLEIPNLATRANRYIGYLVQRYAFDLDSVQSPATARGEEKWLFFYAVSAFCYRVVITTAIVAVVSQMFFFLGTLIAIWAVILMLGVPLAKMTWFLLTSPQLRRRRARAFRVVGGVIGVLAIGLFAVPLPHSTIVQGVVWLPGDGIVHASADGVVTKLLVRPGDNVSSGADLVELDDPLLSARAALLEIRIEELQYRLDRLDLSDLAQARIVREELQLTRADLKFAQERKAALVVRSQTSGTIVLPEADDLVGRFMRRGDIIAYVVRGKEPVIRVIVPESDADLVRNSTMRVSIRMAGDIAHEYTASVAREVPALSDILPSMALSTRGGGEISLDPSDANQKRALAKLLQLDLELRNSPYISRIGGRVYVRFYHGSQPLARRLYRSARQVFLRIFQI